MIFQNFHENSHYRKDHFQENRGNHISIPNNIILLICPLRLPAAFILKEKNGKKSPLEVGEGRLIILGTEVSKVGIEY